MGKDQPTTPPAEQTADTTALEAKLRAEIEAKLRAEYAARPAAPAPDAAPPGPPEGKPATYFHQQGTELVAVAVVASGGTLRHPETGETLVTAAKAAAAPESGRYVHNA